MELIADTLLVAGALGAAVYCAVLSRRLSRFTDLQGGVGGAVAALSAQVDEMTSALERSRGTAEGQSGQLERSTKRAEEVSHRLELLVASLHDMPEQASAAPRRARRPSPEPARERSSERAPKPSVEMEAILRRALGEEGGAEDAASADEDAPARRPAPLVAERTAAPSAVRGRGAPLSAAPPRSGHPVAAPTVAPTPSAPAEAPWADLASAWDAWEPEARSRDDAAEPAPAAEATPAPAPMPVFSAVGRAFRDGAPARPTEPEPEPEADGAPGTALAQTLAQAGRRLAAAQ